MTAPVINTPYTIVDDAYHDAGLLQEGDSVNPEQLVSGMRRMLDMVNMWQTQGIKLWLLVDTAVTLVANQAKYTFKPAGDVDMVKPLRVEQGYYLDVNSVRRPLSVLSWDEYLRLGQVSGNPGTISSYFVDKQRAELDVYFWLTPDATAALGTAHVLLRRQVTNYISSVETLDFPLEWRLALRWGLADDISTGQPQAIVTRCERRAAAFRQALEEWDVEDAPTSFAPDARSQMGGTSFR